MRKITIDCVEITLANPVDKEFVWVGQNEPQRELMASWLTIDDRDLSLTPRVVGVPGVGKTTLVAATAQNREQELYIMQCTSDTRPEDLLITPVLSGEKEITYHASPLLTAVITGGVAILDEGNRMSEKSWASLAGLFDDRRFVESIIAGITIKAHKDFRAAVTMNEDSSTYEIPDYIISRLQPQIKIGFPSRNDELEILKYNVPYSNEELLGIAVDFLQEAHSKNLPYSIRDAVNAIRFTLKQKHFDSTLDTSVLFEDALKKILGDSFLEVGEKLSNAPLVEPSDMNLGSFFFDDDEDDINPDFDFPPDAS